MPAPSAAPARPRSSAHRSPNQRDVQADLRKIRVAVGAGVGAEGNDLKHGKQHSHVPEPADKQIGVRPARRSRRPRDRDQQSQPRRRPARPAGLPRDRNRKPKDRSARRVVPNRRRRKRPRCASRSESVKTGLGAFTRWTDSVTPAAARARATSGSFSKTNRQGEIARASRPSMPAGMC